MRRLASARMSIRDVIFHPLEPASPKRAIAASADQVLLSIRGPSTAKPSRNSRPGVVSVEEVSEAVVAVATTLKWIRAGHPSRLFVVSSIFQVILLIFQGCGCQSFSGPPPHHPLSYERLTLCCGARIGVLLADCGNSRGGPVGSSRPNR